MDESVTIENELSDFECCQTDFCSKSPKRGEVKLKQNNSISISVRGRLKKYVAYWQSVGSSQFILDIIELGYKIPFFETPTAYVGKNNLSARKHQSFVNEAISELLKHNCIEEIHECPEIINPLSVTIQSSGKKRLILDLRHVNQCVYKQKFKCEDMKTIIQLIDKDFYMFKFDLKSAYHHVEIHEQHRQYLSFAWGFGDSALRYFQFCVLPFGLSSAPYIFTKLLKPLIKSWRKQGIPIAVYLDDGLGAGKNALLAQQHSLTVHSTLLKAGFIINEPKSVWDPTQIMIWLGYLINTKDNTIEATKKRIKKLKTALREVLSIELEESIHVKELASIVGQIISLEMAAGNVVRFMTRSAYRIINTCSSWKEKVLIDSITRSEFVFWYNNISNLNCKQLWPDNIVPSKVVYSDASAHACGAILNLDEKIFHTNWTEEERMKSSTWRELQTVLLALQTFEIYVQNRTIAWFTDNQNVVSIVSKGSRVAELQDMALKLFEICLNSHINLDIQWVPRELNTQADSISQIQDYDDYTLNDFVFAKLDQLWGPHTVDRFACCYNTKLVRFNSRFYHQGAEAVDAFTQNWSFNNNWLFPPTVLIIRVIKHLRACQASGTLIVPIWKSAVFWTMLCADGVHWNSWVHDWRTISNYNNLIVKGKSKNSIFTKNNLSFDMVALRVSFSGVTRAEKQGFCTSKQGVCSECAT